MKSQTAPNTVIIWIDGQPYRALQGQTVAAVLAANGIRTYRHTEKSGAGRGLYCGMGICYECLVTINGTANQRACVTYVTSDMRVATRNRVGHGS
jgi:predicted molibdopterin-dependent oxidoreductase YjgC